jgi:hypothetical protein
MTEDYSARAIKSVTEATVAYCKFITPNDAGSNGAHQSGYYLHKTSHKLIFDKPIHRGENLEKLVTIQWQGDFETQSRFIYYGQGTRDEYRLTRFGRDFPFLDDDDVGSLLVLCRLKDDSYKGFVLRTEEEIESFLEYFNIPASNPNGLIEQLTSTAENLENLIAEYVTTIRSGFPSAEAISKATRKIFAQFSGQDDDDILSNPDQALVNWIDTEYSVFRAIEKVEYLNYLSPHSFRSVPDLIQAANTILNRRKSRAGRALESHLSAIFSKHSLPHSAQKITEAKKKPDFIIPSIELYHTPTYLADKLVFLGAKTTCKDRWRQVINEAARIPQKHLFTLQQGVSANQLEEMNDENLTLVVPEQNRKMFPTNHHSKILSLKEFISYSKEKIV